MSAPCRTAGASALPSTEHPSVGCVNRQVDDRSPGGKMVALLVVDDAGRADDGQPPRHIPMHRRLQSLEYLTRDTVHRARHDRTRMHVQRHTRTRNNHWGLPHLWRYGLVLDEFGRCDCDAVRPRAVVMQAKGRSPSRPAGDHPSGVHDPTGEPAATAQSTSAGHRRGGFHESPGQPARATPDQVPGRGVAG